MRKISFLCTSLKEDLMNSMFRKYIQTACLLLLVSAAIASVQTSSQTKKPATKKTTAAKSTPPMPGVKPSTKPKVATEFENFLLGEWVDSSRAAFSFRNNDGSYAPYSNFTTYKVEKKIITFQPKAKEYFDYKKEVKFKVLKHGKYDSLWLQVIQHPTIQTGDTLTLFRTTRYMNREALQFKEIVYISSPCMGNCENYKIIMLRNGSFLYEGIYKAKPMGKHVGKVSILSLIEMLRLLGNSNYTSGRYLKDVPSDLHTNYFKITMNDGREYECLADQFTPEMNLLVHYFTLLKESTPMTMYNGD